MTSRFTAEEIQDYNTRMAVNCFYAEMKCTDRLANKCRNMDPDVWRKCPKQTKRDYKHRE